MSYLGAQYNNLDTKFAQIETGGSYASYALDGNVAPANTAHVIALIYSEDQTLVDNCVLTID